MKTTFNANRFGVLAILVATGWPLPSRADVVPPCNVFDTLITCDAKDVGKACQGGGQCYAVSCSTGMTVYKCDACPAILPAPDAGCAPAKFGTPCGDGGMCSSTQPYCNTSPSKYVCAGPAPAKPTGPPAGETGGAGGSASGGIGAVGGNGGAAGDSASGGTGVVGGNSGSTGGSASGGTGVVGGNSGAAGTGAADCPSCGSSGGCDVAPRATGPAAIALGLLAVGMLALFYDRRRKRRR